MMYYGGTGFIRIEFLIYPLFILLLPIFTSRNALLAAGFCIGILVDLFYDSPGVHASAAVLTAFMRPRVLRRFEPGDGYEHKTPTIRSLGLQWFAKYAAMLMGIHVLAYYSMEVFNVLKTGQVLLRAAWGFLWSWALIMAIMLTFNPKE